jgi:hypothetical protein
LTFFLLSLLPCCASRGRNWLEPCGNDSILFASRTYSFPLSPFPMPRIDVAHNHSMSRVLSWIGLTEVYTDDSQLNSTGIDDDDSYISTSKQNLLNLFRRCVTVWNVWAFKILHGPMVLSWLGQPLPQDMLIKNVRHHPSLRWLSSNDSEENITMPRCEWREITLVCDKLCWKHTFQVGYSWHLCIFCSEQESLCHCIQLMNKNAWSS